MTAADRIKPGLYPAEAAIAVEPLDEPQTAGDLVETPAEGMATARAEPLPKGRRGPGRWLAIVLIVLAVALVGAEAGFFLADMFDRHVLLGAFFSLLIGLGGISAAYWILSEMRQLRRLKSVDAIRAEAEAIAGAGGYGRALPFIAHAERLLGSRPGMKARFVRLQDMVLDTHGDRDILALFRREILRPLDREAYRVVSGAAQWTAVGVSVSPVAAVDAALAIWRSLRMIRQIGEVYGFRPGLASTVLLARHVLKGAAYLSAAEVVGDLWTQHLGGRLAGLVSAKLAEGVYAAVRMARLGLLAMETCRPLPFTKEDEPSLNRLRKEVLARLK